MKPLPSAEIPCHLAGSREGDSQSILNRVVSVEFVDFLNRQSQGVNLAIRVEVRPTFEAAAQKMIRF
jgi:hypothetical protein